MFIHSHILINLQFQNICCKHRDPLSSLQRVLGSVIHFRFAISKLAFHHEKNNEPCILVKSAVTNLTSPPLPTRVKVSQHFHCYFSDDGLLSWPKLIAWGNFKPLYRGLYKFWHCAGHRPQGDTWHVGCTLYHFPLAALQVPPLAVLG